MLMRKIEKECTELNYTTNGSGHMLGGGGGNAFTMDNDEYMDDLSPLQGGTYTLGGNTKEEDKRRLPVRELAARAALMRMSAEEEEIERNCGCCLPQQNLFLPTTTTAES